MNKDKFFEDYHYHSPETEVSRCNSDVFRKDYEPEVEHCDDDACDIEELLTPPDVSEVAPEEPLVHGYPKNKLFGYDKIDEIHVKCPKYDATYVLNPDEPELICPVCGDFHELKDYMIWYKDGSSCTAKAASR